MNKNRGFFLLEINIMLMVILLLLVTFYQQFIQITLSLNRIEEDIILSLQTRLLLGRLEEELTFHTQELLLREDTDLPFVRATCLKQDNTCYRKFYCRQGREEGHYILYQETKNGDKAMGINPLTPPQMSVTAFELKACSEKSVMLVLELMLLRSGRRKRAVRYIPLLNGGINAKREERLHSSSLGICPADSSWYRAADNLLCAGGKL